MMAGGKYMWACDDDTLRTGNQQQEIVATRMLYITRYNIGVGRVAATSNQERMKERKDNDKTT